MPEEDILKTFTDKEFKILALLELLEDEMWVNGMEMIKDGETIIINGDTYGKTVNEVADRWKAYFKVAINDNAWNNGKHAGDCTHIPMTCFRCMCEEQLKKIRTFPEKYDKIISFDK